MLNKKRIDMILQNVSHSFNCKSTCRPRTQQEFD